MQGSTLRKILLLVTLLGPALAWGTRYRIDLQPQANLHQQAMMALEKPWTAFEIVRRADVLTLLNFVPDSEPEAVEGVDYPRYKRSRHFGSWLNLNPQEDCYNTRAEILIAESKAPVTFSQRNPCLVATGLWTDAYTGADFSDARDIHIDHAVPLKNAYVSGAWKWTRRQRCHYANFAGRDSHLVVVSARENMSKGDRTPAGYMPPNPASACAYLHKWLNVKAIWNLTLDEEEATAIFDLMEKHACESEYQTITSETLERQRAEVEEEAEACPL